MKIITGYKGEPHITAAQDGLINAGIYGKDTYILPIGEMLNPTVESANEVRIASGVLMMEGRAAVIEPGTYDSLTIQNGAQGYRRYDLIVASYRKDGDGTESITLEVIQGTPVDETGTPVKPDYTSGSIIAGDTFVQVPVASVYLDGITIKSAGSELPPDLQSVSENYKNIRLLNSDVRDLQDGLGYLRTIRKSRTGSGTINYSADGASNALLVTSGASATAQGMWIVNSTSAGSFNITAIKAAAGITVSGASYDLTLSSTLTGTVTSMLFILNGTYE